MFLEQSNSEYKSILGKPFEYKEDMDILCGKHMSRGSLAFNSNANVVDLERRLSFGDEDSPFVHTNLNNDFSPFVIPRVGESTFQFTYDGLNEIPSQVCSQANDSGTGEYIPSSSNKRASQDEATSPEKITHITPSSSKARGKRQKIIEEATSALKELCSLNNERLQLHKLLSGTLSHTQPNVDDSCSIKECLQKLKSLPGFTQDILYIAATRFKDTDFRTVFMALDDEDKLGWILHDRP